MLILSRKRGERIVIGPDIELTVVAIRGERVQLGFCAPQEVAIHRVKIHGPACSDREADEEDRFAQALPE